MKTNKILVLQGVQASGKSTYARSVTKNNKEWVIVSRDSIRDSRGDYWIPEQEDYISAVEEFQIREALSRGLNVIIDAMNLNPKTIDKWNKLAEETKFEIEFKLFEIEYKEALKRDKERGLNGTGRSVGEKVLRKTFRTYFPQQFYNETVSSDHRNIKLPDYTLYPCIICDIDGTIALRSNRSPFDYSKVLDDYHDPRLAELLKLLMRTHEAANTPRLIFFSGRENIGDCYKHTQSWLESVLPYTYFELYMRKDGDHRSDAIVKKEMYDEHIKDKYDVLCVFDDRNRVVDMWRELGLLCCQVYYGDF